MINTMRRILAPTLLIFALIFVSIPSTVSAATMTYEEGKVHAALLKQIKSLLAEVVRLQELLAKQEERSLQAGSYTPYETVIFPLSFERIYEVESQSLKNTGNENGQRSVDKQLFELFAAVIGEEAVDEYIKEWRVFNNKNSDLGAFVELIAGTESWVVGVNRESYVAGDEQLTRAFANLFVHEYAHILLFNETAFETTYKSLFWTGEDVRHSARVQSMSDQFSVLNRYYDENRSRFVSDYATLSAEEDMAETFVSFVREARPTGTTIREKKINQFYTSKVFVEARAELRANLQALGVL